MKHWALFNKEVEGGCMCKETMLVCVLNAAACQSSLCSMTGFICCCTVMRNSNKVSSRSVQVLHPGLELQVPTSAWIQLHSLT